MRNLLKNEKTYIAVRYKGVLEYRDSQGNLTGEKTVQYYPPQVFKAHISGARGGIYVELFGTDVNYDKTIVLTKQKFSKLKFDDNTVFFIEKKPEFKDGMPLYDYRVLKIAETVNEVVMAIKKVNK